MLDVRTWRGADAGSDYELVVTRIMVKFMCGGGGGVMLGKGNWTQDTLYALNLELHNTF